MRPRTEPPADDKTGRIAICNWCGKKWAFVDPPGAKAAHLFICNGCEREARLTESQLIRSIPAQPPVYSGLQGVTV